MKAKADKKDEITFNVGLKALIKACVVSLVISLIWFLVEYIQFGELQGNRICDNVVYVLYLLVLWYLFSHQNKKSM